MVSIPHWTVCFWPGSCPHSEEVWPERGCQQLVTIILQILWGPRWRRGGGWHLQDLWLIISVTGSKESSWQNLYQPISTTTWHGKTARHSSHRRSVSWLSLRLSGSCHFTAADSNPFGSQTWLCCLVVGLGGWSKQIQSLWTFYCTRFRNVMWALHSPYSFEEIKRISHLDPFFSKEGIRRCDYWETCTLII